MALSVEERRSIVLSRIAEQQRQAYNYRLDQKMATAAGDTATAEAIDGYLLTADDKVYALEAELRELDAEAAQSA